MATGKVNNVDVHKLYGFLEKYVKIKLKTKEEIEGLVYTIDPISENVVLLKKVNDNIKMSIVMNHAVECMDIIENECEYIETSKLFTNQPQASVGISRNCIVKFLNVSDMPYTEDGDVIQLQGVRIYPPYGPNNCISESPIKLLTVENLLNRIQTMVEAKDPRLVD